MWMSPLEGRDPEEIEFIPLSGNSDGQEDEVTNSLDANAGTPKDKGCDNSGELDV